MTHSASAAELLDRADAARAAGQGATAARLYDEAAARCRADDDLDGWTRAVLGTASVHLFGAEPGRIPAQLYDVLARTTDEATRARLAAALARCWVYAGHAARGVRFADEAVAHAERVGAPELVADSLDAALAAHWGPDELEVRRNLVARLDEVAAHVLDPDARLQAHLWGLQVACESLDLQGMHRQIRALERLGEESARARFFAASRRQMLDLLRGRTDTTPGLIAVADEAAQQAGLADAWMVVKAMGSYAAAQSGDLATCRAGAAAAEEFALAEGVATVCAEAAYLWSCCGEQERARALVHTFKGPVLAELPRDVSWLLILQCVLAAALAAADREVIETAYELLLPYAGRAVFDSGAVMFHGTTDDTLARAAAELGDQETAARLRARALATYERLGAVWWRERLASWRPGSPDQIPFHPVPGGLWLVGSATLKPLRGFAHLRELLRRPGIPVEALDLAGASVEADLGDMLDRQALQAYRQRLRDLDEELDEAGRWSDAGRLETLTAERDALLAELARATGLGGRSRRAGGGAERARIAVQKAISAAIDRIGATDEALADHLRARVHTGLQCVYQPEPGDGRTWILS